MPPLPRFDRILKSVFKQFKKNQKKYKTFALHPNLCPSNHTNQQTWNNANLLKKSSQNGLSSMKVHGFQAKWQKLQLISNDSFTKCSHILHMCVYLNGQQVCQMKFSFSLHEKTFFIFRVPKLGSYYEGSTKYLMSF